MIVQSKLTAKNVLPKPVWDLNVEKYATGLANKLADNDETRKLFYEVCMERIKGVSGETKQIGEIRKVVNEYMMSRNEKNIFSKPYR